MHKVFGLVALLAAAGQAAAADGDAAITGTRLDVVATGEATRPPDLATVGAGVEVIAGSAAAAMAESARRTAAITAALARAGVGARDVQTASLQLQPQYRDRDGEQPAITGYRASDQLTVRLRDLAGAGAVVDALVAAGANRIEGPDLSLADPAAALDEARTQALAAARARAALYARAAGLSVARIIRIEEDGSDQSGPAPRMVMVTARKAASAIAPGEQRIAATLHVTFELR